MRTSLPPKTLGRRLAQFAWDAWCVVSVAGIWPRFIEPRLLQTTAVELPIEGLPRKLDGLRILQFSDLHLGNHVPDSFLKKLSSRISDAKPDVLLFTGDFLCYSQISEIARLSEFLKTLTAKYGCFATLGNHDYEVYASVDRNGNPRVVERVTPALEAGFKRLLKMEVGSGGCIPIPEHGLPRHSELDTLLADSPFELLENRSVTVNIEGAPLEITGLGDLWAGNFAPDRAMSDAHPTATRIICSHNPDTITQLSAYPGQLVLSGHTHGGQVNLPWFRDNFLSMQKTPYHKGLHRVDDKWLYVSRGIGGTIPFRWRTIPELAEITLRRAP